MAGLNESRMIIGSAFGASALGSVSTPRHAQHGTTLLVGVDGPIAVTTAVGRIEARAVLVPPDVEHAVESRGPLLGLLYDCEQYGRTEGEPRAIESPAVVHAHRASIFQRDVLEGIGREVAKTIRAPSRLDRRVAHALEALRALERPNVPRISAAHLQALFTRDVGIPMRTYRLWQRLLGAVIALRELDATRAAHAAGFADLAHFSRTCRRMLGYSPSEMRDGLTRA